MELTAIKPSISGPISNEASLPDDARAKAEELEGVFLNILVSQMFSGLKTDGNFGGGFGEETWRSMQSEQFANMMAKTGGIGLADQIVADILTIQESAQATPKQTISARGAYK